jgi:hypothetical protein|tara:strand:+ start:339 stop:542 length:204 start_codon:yes stop_codon:yes gene_type:complete
MTAREEQLKIIVVQYAQSILEMVNHISPKNINQTVSLIKANLKVLEDDVRNTFVKSPDEDFNYREYN